MTHPVSAWRRKEALSPTITRLWEPFVDPWFQANIFYVRGQTRDLVIDSGIGIVPLMPDLPAAQSRPVTAIATHIHVDHVGALHEFRQRIGHRAEAGMFARMQDEDTRAFRLAELPLPFTQAPRPLWTVQEFRLTPAPLTCRVDEGDVIETGNERWTVLHLPGHSPGSIGLLNHDGTILFSGDAIYDGQLVDDLPHSDKAAYRETMRRLAALTSVETVYGGHGEPMSGKAMREKAADYVQGLS